MPNIDRREFLKLVGAGGVGAGAGFMLRESIKHPTEYLIPYVNPPEDFSHGIATWYNSVCSVCSAGCGISVRTREGRAKKIEGNASHPVSQGGLCAKGQAGLQLLYNPDRITGPLQQTAERGPATFEEITWDEGISRVAGQLDLLRAAIRGNRVCILSQGVRGQLAELFERFMLHMGSNRLVFHDFDHPHTLYAANERFYGEQQLPYYDIKNTRFLLSFGADFLTSWISPVHHSLGYGESRQGTDVRGRFVQIEPRMSLSGAAADEWIAAIPGTEGVLALGLANHIVNTGRYQGLDRDEWSAALASYNISEVAGQTGIAEATLTSLAEQFFDTSPSLAIGGGGAANHSNGVDNLVAINTLNYLAGNIGVSGGLLFNPEPAGRISHQYQASYQSMVDLAEDARQGNIEVLIINGTNPVFNLPSSAGFREAIEQIPLVVSLSSVMDETTAMADLILPSNTYLESWGDDFPEPGVGFPSGAVSQPVVSPLYNTRATGDIILNLAHHMGLSYELPWNSMEDMVKDGWRQIYERGGEQAGADSFETFWEDILKAGVWGETTRRDQAFTLDSTVISGIGVPEAEFSGAAEEFPFMLHPYESAAFQDGRGANLPWMQELPDPLTSVVYGSWVEMNPVTASELGLTEGDLVDIVSPHGQLRAPVFVYPAIRPDVIAMPIGQGHSEYGRYAKERGVNPIEILSPLVETGTGALAINATRVSVVATGQHVDLIKTGGNSRELGREIVPTTSTSSSDDPNVKLNSIPIKVV